MVTGGYVGGISTQCENKALGIKLLDLAYKRIKYSLISTLLVSVLITTALWPAVDRGKLAVWLLSMWLIVLIRNFIAQQYLNPGRGDSVEFGKWKSMLAIGAAASGVCWGVTVFFIPASSLDQATLLLIFVTAGVTAFASVSLATVPVAAFSFLLSALLPLVVWLFSFGERIQFFMGVIALSYLGGMLLFSRQMYKLMFNSFSVAEQNRALTSVLQESDQRMAHYFESAPGFFYTVLKRSDGSYAMPFASAGIRDLFGLDPADVAHDIALLAAMVHSDDSEMTLRKTEQSAKNMMPYHVEYRIVHPQKGVRWMEAHSLPHPMSESGMRWDGFMHDITERKRMEEELHQREQMFRTLAENAPDPILRYDSTCRRIYSNAALTRISGMSADALAGTLPEGVPTLPSDENTKLIRCIRQVLETGKLAEGEIKFVLKDGSIRIFNNRYAPEFGTDGAVVSVLTFATDITEIKRLEGELCRQVEFQQTLLNALCDVGIQLMMIENGRIIHVGNREIARQFGYSDADLDAQPELADFIHPDDRMRVMEYYIHRLKGDPVPASYELGLITRAGERREYETAVAVVPGTDPVRVITVGKDITERKQLEEGLAARERDFRSLAENIPDNVARWDAAGCFLYSNPVHQRTLGKSFGELAGKTHGEIFPDGRFASFDEMLAKVVAAGQEGRIARVPVPNPVGGTDLHDVRLTPEFDAEGRVVSVLGLGRDMTGIYRLQADLATRERELRSLAESSPGMMGSFYFRPDGSICMPYVSQKIEELFGLQPQDVVNDAAPLMALTHPDDAQRVAESIAESARSMTRWHEEYRIIHPARGERWMESNTNPELHPDGGIIWYGYIHDITERKEMEDALAARERDFRSLGESSPDSVIRYDLERRILYLNDHLVRDLKLASADEVIGKRPIDVWPDGRFAAIDDAAKRVIASGINESVELVWAQDSGDVRIGQIVVVPERDAAGKIAGTIAFGRDITAIRSLEKRHAQYFAVAPGLFATIEHRADGSYAMPFASAGIRDLFALEPDAVMRDIGLLVARAHPDDVEMTFRKTEESERDLTLFHIEYRINHPTRGVRWLEVRSMPIRLPDGGTRWDGFYYDITDRKDMENTLHRGQESLAEAQRISKIGSWELDLVSNNLIWSDEIFRIFEIDQKQFGASYEAFLHFIHPDDREAVNKAYTESLASRAPYMIEHRLLMNDGRIKFVQEHCETHYSEDGKLLRSLGTVQDVTERKTNENIMSESFDRILELNTHLEESARNLEEQAVELEASQDQLKQTEEWYRSILLSAPDGMLVFDERGVIRQVNKQLVTMFGYTDGELQGSHIEMLLPPEAREHHVHQRTDLFAGGIVASPVDGTMNNLRGCRKDGLEFPVDVSLSRLPDLDGRVGAICASIRDISERKAVETARENALAEAIRLAEMRSTFLSQMSHELRTPLNGILGFEQLLQMDSAINEGQRAKLHIIRESGEHLLALVNQILDYAKIEADKLELNLEDMQLDAFLDAVVGIIGVRAEQKKLAFVYEADGDLSGIVRGDELRLRQVLLNLLANAIKFTDCGEVSLRVSMPVSARIRFEVRDSGIGIAESQWEAIFQPFEQLGEASRIAQGTGLGLAISRKLVRLMGGDIKVESQPGAGSMFSFEIEMETVRSGEVKQLNADALTKQAATSVTPMTPHIVAPPQQELDTMHGLAMRGNMRDIMQHATRLAELDERYSPFSNYVCQLCKGFQTKALMSLIAQYRNEKEIE
jgi:PAS domain S-box-containing protein